MKFRWKVRQVPSSKSTLFVLEPNIAFIWIISNEIPILIKCWHYIGDICDESLILKKYRFYIGNIGNERSKYFFSILVQHWQYLYTLMMGQYCEYWLRHSQDVTNTNYIFLLLGNRLHQILIKSSSNKTYVN